jgi:polyvinyl alcohol dehydrogenase (cytochrome)
VRSLIAISFVLLIASSASAQQAAPNGEAVYKQHCAGCHEGSLPRMPNREALKGFSPEAVETALSSFSMRRQGATLSPAERRAVSAFVTGRAPGSYRAPLEAIAKTAFCSAGTAAGRDPLTGASWNGWGGDLRNTRFQSAASAGLSATDVPKLKLKWAFGLPGVSASGSQVTVVGSRAVVGSRNGVVYALDTRTGCVAWGVEADAGVRSTPVVDRASNTVYFGDAHANVYALDVITGARKWKVQVDTHLDAMITGGVVYHEGKVYVPVSSLEESTAAMAMYECCTFRGSIVSLDARNGKQIWKTFTITQAPQRTTKNARGTQLWGPSGGSVWSAPALDPERNRMYITTGDSYSNPPAAETDAIMALAMDTGKVLWTRQGLAGDSWNVGCLEAEGPGRVNCPEKAGPDHDFGSSPALAALADGRRMLLAGQKSGALYGLNPDTGEIAWKTQVGAGGVLGGIEWGFATDGSTAFVSLSSALEKKPGEAGGLVAINVADGTKRWTAAPPRDTCNGRQGCNTAQPQAVTAMPGVAFSGSLDGHLRAYDTTGGTVLWDFNTLDEFETVNGVQARGGSLNGPGATVAGGMVFVSSGYSSIGFMPGNVLLAFTVEGK